MLSYRLSKLQIPSFNTLWHIGTLCRPPYIIAVLVQGPHYYFTIFRWILRSYSTDTILRVQIASNEPTPTLYSACETDKSVLRYASITRGGWQKSANLIHAWARSLGSLAMVSYVQLFPVIETYLSYALFISQAGYGIRVGSFEAIWTPKILSVL